MAIQDGPSRWVKSSRSNGAANCVEVALLPDGSVKLRDSKTGEAGPVLTFTPSEWTAFLAGVRDGEFDPAR
ncbi:MAG: DUF397 domain-containing protein [Actinomycetota bacterium]|nr:DUF397 domain-containing protein [Actinomycetota bacterium]